MWTVPLVRVSLCQICGGRCARSPRSRISPSVVAKTRVAMEIEKEIGEQIQIKILLEMWVKPWSQFKLGCNSLVPSGLKRNNAYGHWQMTGNGPAGGRGGEAACLWDLSAEC